MRDGLISGIVWKYVASRGVSIFFSVLLRCVKKPALIKNGTNIEKPSKNIPSEEALPFPCEILRQYYYIINTDSCLTSSTQCIPTHI